MALPTLITFAIYFIVLLLIGLYFCRPNDSIEDYLLGNRGMGAWVTALSTQASDMSGWLLMGLPGIIYAGGIANAWIAVGLLIGTVLNWKLVSARLRVYTKRTNTITLPCFFEERFGDATGLLRVVSAVVILIFFTIYASSGLVAGGDREKVFICMINEVVHPWAAGIMLSAILSAIMSTIDSQLLVSSSALIEDLYRKTFRRAVGQRQAVLMGRVCVIVISAAALLLALHPNDTILGIVAYAWGGFGAAFGPLILFALFSRRTTWQAALAGMVTGTIVLVVWKFAGLSEHLYEIVPGFLANSVVIVLVNRLIPQNNALVLQQFDEVVRALRDLRHGETKSDLEGAPSFERT